MSGYRNNRHFEKIKASSLACRIESIVLHFHGLSKSLRQCATAALQFRVCSAIVGLKLAIDDWLSSRCQLTPIASWCDRLARTMLLSACLHSSGVLFELATIGILGHTFHRCAPFCFHFFVHGTAIRFRLDRTEWNGNVTVFLTQRKASTVC